MTERPPDPAAKARPRRRRWVRVVGVVLIAGVVALGAGAFALTRPGVQRALVLGQVSKRLGVPVRADAVRLSADGTLRIDGLCLLAPGMLDSGDPAAHHAEAEFCTVATLVADVDFAAIFGGGRVLRSVELRDAVVRISQHEQTGQINLAGLALGSSGSGPLSDLPGVRVADARVELGIHGPRGYEAQRIVPVRGVLGVAPDNPAALEFSLEQTGGVMEGGTGRTIRPLDRPISVRGRIDERGVVATLDRLTLDEWTADLLPPALRPAWSALGLSGEVPGVDLFVSPAGDPSVEVRLDGVGVSLPFESLGAARYGPPPSRPMRLSDTRGTVRVASGGVSAELDGLFEGLRYAVELGYHGLSGDAPFRCVLRTALRVEQEMSVFAFTPPGVMEQLERFGFPSASVRAEVTITRGQPNAGTAAPIDVSGRLAFRDGAAAYFGFPYEFTELSGVAEFDATSLRLTGVRGVAASGAQLEADAWFSPIGDDAEADINVRVTGVPVDQTLIAAMRQDYRTLVEQLFAQDEHTRLTGLGLITDPTSHRTAQERAITLREQLSAWSGPAFAEQAARARDELAHIESSRAPVFAFGGVADVQINVHREFGAVSVWTTTVGVQLPQAGVVPAYFPLPIVARGVRLAIDGEKIRLEDGEFLGVSGGWAKVSAELRLRDAAGATLARPVPDVRIEASDIPLDRLLLAALPGVRDRAAGQGPIELLTRLDVRGLVDATAILGTGTDGSVTYDVRADVEGAGAALATGDTAARGQADESIDAERVAPVVAPVVALGAVTGVVRATNQRSEVDLVGRTLVDGADAGAAAVSAVLQRDGPDGLPNGQVQVELDPLDLRWPIERFVGLVSPEAGARLTSLRDRTGLTGRVTLTARAEGPLGLAPATEPGAGAMPIAVPIEVRVEDVRELAFNADGHRVELGKAAGILRVTTGVSPVVIFEQFAAPVRVDAGSPALITLDGSITIDAMAGGAAAPASGPLHAVLTGARFDDALSKWAAERAGVSASFAALAPAGEYDLSVTLTQPGGGIDSRGTLRPRSLSMLRDGQRVSLGVLDGQIDFEPAPDGLLARTTSLSARTPEWRAEGSGVFRRSATSGAWSLSASGQAESLGLPEDLLALLPAPVGAGIEALGVRTEESVRVPEIFVELSGGVAGGGAGASVFDVRGRAEVSGVAARPGVEVTGFEGAISFEARNASSAGASGGPPEARIGVAGTRARAAGVRASAINASVRTTERPGEWAVENIAATVHGGRVTGGALVRTGAAGPDGAATTRFAADVQLAGVRAAPVLRDLGVSKEPEQPGAGDGWNVAGDYSRGIMEGSVSLSGSTGASVGGSDDRIGRGALTISGGELLKLPGILNLIEASNLQVPIGSQIHSGRASFFLDGGAVVFEELSASSEQVELYGYGVMAWPSGELDLRFFSRGKRRLPLIGPVLEGLRDEIIRTRITGKPGEIRVGAEAFGGVARPLRELAGQDDAELAQRMRDLERRVRSGAARMQSQGSLDERRSRGAEIGSAPTDD